MKAPAQLDVLIPHFDDVDALERSLTSVAAQTWSGDFRVVVVDDGSPSSVFAAVEEMAADQAFEITVVRLDHNRGRPFARNALLAAVEAPHLAWLDAGEEWYPRKLEQQMAHLEQLGRDGADLDRVWVTCHYDLDRDGQVGTQRQNTSGDQLARLLFGDDLRAYLWTLVGRTTAFRAAGLFDEALPRLQDLDYWIRFLLAGGRLAVPDGDEPLCRYDKSDIGRAAADVATSADRIMDKHRSVYDRYGATMRSRARWNFSMVSARYAWHNGDRLAAARYAGRAVASNPAHTLRRTTRKLGRSSSPPPLPDGDGAHVMFVCQKLAGLSGGAERVLIELANALRERGHRVSVVSHELRDGPPFYPLADGIVHVNLSPRGSVRRARDKGVQGVGSGLYKPRRVVFPFDRIAWAARYLPFRIRLGRHIDATRPDVVVPFMPPAIVATALADTTHRPRLVASMHNAPEQDFENPARWDPGPYAQRRRLELMDRMDAIAVLLEDYQSWYAPELRAKTVVVPNAVEPVDPDLLAGAVRTPTILAVGRLAKTKRHDLSLRAFARLADDFPGWQLKIFGGYGPLEGDLRGLITELGIADRARLDHTDEIGREYLSASILSHPATFEGFPLAVTEALASGLPVIGFSDCSGLNSLVRDDENGRLIDPGDGTDTARLDGLVAELRSLMADETERRRLGDNGPTSMAPYRPDLVVDLWERLLIPR